VDLLAGRQQTVEEVGYFQKASNIAPDIRGKRKGQYYYILG
jgi:hypothetical protein